MIKKMMLSVLLVCCLTAAGCKQKDSSAAGAECTSDSDCVPDACCHATGCVPREQAPDCTDIMCTMECKPGTLDCGGTCICEQGACTPIYVDTAAE
ncbi:hypothetical protein GF351_04485 [Candidatus Woesearchaeota archaeon]|nr:hypothetical protein [Candidatus Woesearchaeota archaeon]